MGCICVHICISNEILFRLKKEYPSIHNVDESRRHILSETSQTEREKLHDQSCIWNLKKPNTRNREQNSAY